MAGPGNTEKETISSYFGRQACYLAEGSYGRCWRIKDEIIKVFSPHHNTAYEIEKGNLEALNSVAVTTVRVPCLIDSGSLVVAGEVHPFLRYTYIDGNRLEEGNLKACDPETLAAFLAECHSQPANILGRTIGLKDTPEYILTHIPGHSWPKDFAEFALREASRIQKVIAAAGIQHAVPMHNDLVPDNILLTENGEIGIIDFGNMIAAPPAYDFRHLWRFDKEWTTGLIRAYDEKSGGKTDLDLVDSLSLGRTLYLVTLLGKSGRWRYACEFARFLPEKAADNFIRQVEEKSRQGDFNPSGPSLF